jgi:tRNA(Ile)-lysidine synthase
MSAEVAPPWRLAVACSGGRDSIALLYATARMAQELRGIEVFALHVHHGMSPHADAWLTHTEALCAAWAEQGLPVAFRWRRVRLNLTQGKSVEAVARVARYAALAEMAHAEGCDTVMLAHHRRDQAETFLLQALRGAGVAGLAAMPAQASKQGITWLRPWLNHSRAAIEAYVAAHGLTHVEDESNDDRRYARNRLRHVVWPELTQAFEQAESTLAQAAAHQADVLACLDDWLSDKLPLLMNDAGMLKVLAWKAWPEGPQRELLRAWFRLVTGVGLTASWVNRLQAETSSDGPCRWPLHLQDGDGMAAQGEVVLYRGLLAWRAVGEGDEANAAKEADASWPLGIDAVGRWTLPAGMGSLIVSAVDEGECGLPLARLANAELRPRLGGERFQMAVGRPARSLKKQFQMMGLPAWERDGPLLWSGDELLFVPGLGIHAPALAIAPGPRQVTLRWEPPAHQDSIKVTE